MDSPKTLRGSFLCDFYFPTDEFIVGVGFFVGGDHTVQNTGFGGDGKVECCGRGEGDEMDGFARPEVGGYVGVCRVIVCGHCLLEDPGFFFGKC